VTDPGYFIDTNVFLRHLLNDHPTQSPRCLALFEAIERGEERGWTTDMVIAEIVWVLSSKPYEVKRATIAQWLLVLTSLPGLKVENRTRLSHTLRLYTSTPIDFIDAYNAAFIMRRQGPAKLYSFDTHFDRVPELTRLEPGRRHHAEAA